MNDSIKKCLLCALPFLSGIQFQLFQTAAHWQLPYFGISLSHTIFAITSCILFLFCNYLFASSQKINDAAITTLWFDFKIPRINRLIITTPYLISLILLPCITNWGIAAFIRTCILGVVIEEMLARGIFIKYPTMSNKEFLLWSTVSNCAFSLNHWLYDLNYHELAAIDQVQKFFMHLAFGCMLSGMVFKSKKIELSIFRHSWSNISIYLYRYNLTLATLNSALWFLLDYLNLIGLDAKKRVKTSRKYTIA